MQKALCAGLLGLLLAGPAASDGASARQEWRWHLTGIVVGPHLQEALFGTGSETRVVLLGAQLDGWTLTDIRRGGVTLRRKDEEKRLGADEWLPDDARAADSLRRLQQFEAQKAASAALERQREDQARAETALTQATEGMQQAKPR